ncbi:S9 family peptidase [Halomonas piscis]|uniref:S9 family peptidase n=1 Tax=Halomonas piscis TaxID=3031727 RepID=UPI0028A0F870|nr:prolyl oligopeptidase family serine peptidase [Halomonas piscis]
MNKAQPERTELSPVLRYFRSDAPDWHWLEDDEAPATRAFLEAANAEHAAWFAPLEPLAEALYRGHLARRELASTSLETELDHYTVYSVTGADDDYPRWWRYPNGEPDARECFFDLPARAAGQAFFEIGDMALAPDEQWLAWTEDSRGDERFALWLKALPNGTPQRLLDDIGPALCWAEDQTADAATLLFTRFDATQRPDSVWRLPLALAAPVAGDAPRLIWREDDPEFWVGMDKTRSRRWLVLESASKDTGETWVVPAAAPATAPLCLYPRDTGVEAGLDHRPGFFYCLHNRAGAHFQLDVAPEKAALAAARTEVGSIDWQPLVAHRESATLEGVDAFSWGLVLAERDHGLAQVTLRRLVLNDAHCIERDEPLALPETPCSQLLEDAPHFDAQTLTLREESFTQPPRWVELNLASGERRGLKTLPVYGDMAPDKLTSRRLWAKSADGASVPVSVVMRADLADRPLPTLLYGYGAYGDPQDPWFSIARLELLERGVAFAVAHVRGGGERGEPWYLDGKMAHKENSFSDFLAAREALVEQGISQAGRIVAYGASAGGMLVGACVNRAPDAFCAAVLEVPFVDVLRTMQTPELPLTTAEYSEWGNPAEPEVAARIGGYSPVDNVTAQAYPALWIEGSWFDTRVAYWEPAKYYARVTQCQQGEAPVLLYTDMQSGHGGASGRFKAWRDAARQDAFILWALGLAPGL